MVSSWAESRPARERRSSASTSAASKTLPRPLARGPAAQEAAAHVGVQRLALHAEAGGRLGGVERRAFIHVGNHS